MGAPPLLCILFGGKLTFAMWEHLRIPREQGFPDLRLQSLGSS